MATNFRWSYIWLEYFESRTILREWLRLLPFIFKTIFMEHLFLNKDLSLLAKEKGFDEPCLATYHLKTGKIIKIYGEYKSQPKEGDSSNNYWILAPIRQQILDWFYKKYKIDIETKVGISGNWSGYITVNTGNVQKCPVSISHVQNKDELIEQLIEEAFKLI